MKRDNLLGPGIASAAFLLIAACFVIAIALVSSANTTDMAGYVTISAAELEQHEAETQAILDRMSASYEECGIECALEELPKDSSACWAMELFLEQHELEFDEMTEFVSWFSWNPRYCNSLGVKLALDHGVEAKIFSLSRGIGVSLAVLNDIGTVNPCIFRPEIVDKLIDDPDEKITEIKKGLIWGAVSNNPAVIFNNPGILDF